MTLPTSKVAVLQKFPGQPYRYFGPFDNDAAAQKYIEENDMKMSYAIELRDP
ncbi:hypothetical protein SEA_BRUTONGASTER_54 [Gordonia phage BrutonGaster]|uniref:Uncharacterized protein n=1 Tax=Gordonia phage BrutonGaster TaxID=2530116 RepID=A0A482JHM7_9CAUD|nr:hypothetical protein HOV26_gp128 [Gordonia phage BrutonGaster]QBP33271.1 hypothetical protein SEA_BRUTONGASTER_54 [Gordonia phage BrutonGaster]